MDYSPIVYIPRSEAEWLAQPEWPSDWTLASPKWYGKNEKFPIVSLESGNCIIEDENPLLSCAIAWRIGKRNSELDNDV